MRKIEFKELIEIFITWTIPSIGVEKEIPRINFIFNSEGIELINSVSKNPFILKNSWTPSIAKEDIEKLKNLNKSNYPNIEIDNPIEFFKLLTDIVNSQIKLYTSHNIHVSERNVCINVLLRIWLRMDKNDFKDINSFLKKELDFLNDNTLDKYNNREIDTYEGYKVTSLINANETWDETSKSIYFILGDKDSSHTVSHINYAIREEDNEKVCYIYAVQSDLVKTTNKKIERKLYKLNKGVKIQDVHPNQLFPLIELINLLKLEGITTVKVPTNQELNYEYHEILSRREEERFQLRWPKSLINKILLSNSQETEYQRKLYLLDKTFYEHIVGKSSKIRELKTTKLFALLKRLSFHIPNFQLSGTDKTNNEILIYNLSK